MNDDMVMKSGGGGRDRRTQNPGSRSQVFQGPGKMMHCFDPCRKALPISQHVENLCSLVSAQGVYLFYLKASHVLKVMLKLNPHD